MSPGIYIVCVDLKTELRLALWLSVHFGFQQHLPGLLLLLSTRSPAQPGRMIDLRWRGKGQVHRYIDERMYTLHPQQRAAYDDAVSAKQESGRNMCISIRLVVDHLDVELEFRRVGIVLRDDGTNRPRCLSLQCFADERTFAMNDRGETDR